MARKRGEYQNRKERQDKIKDIFGVIAVLLVGFILAWYIINNAVAIRDIRRNILEEYTGSYSCQLKTTYGKSRHYYYLITLDNGDVLSIPKSSCENELIFKDQRLLTFRYSEHVRRAIFSTAYSVLAMETADGKVMLLNLETSHRNCIRNIWIFSILLSIWILLFAGLFLLYYFVVIHDKRIVKRQKVKKKKLKNKM